MLLHMHKDAVAVFSCTLDCVQSYVFLLFTVIYQSYSHMYVHNIGFCSMHSYPSIIYLLSYICTNYK